ncbi:Chondramide synthase cmdD (plasmid) [Sulfitobacter sp. DSM 110093]|uniref:condensation domain-containing protein n=1 Tax=Sulfitobacter sp. DSM 110093 TaxID=2883127 RepID=UPI001FADA995|nr:condensation domain-containing protein [Sulfitobacter sp. DSM 110093]UOA33738.1 Chondramide synthase cmdD [Sulfitobacter sp. DSM 110093]UOA33999.1 Chondramide synthase cmdD [Sulfitobacter sp. DSM 110093]
MTSIALRSRKYSALSDYQRRMLSAALDPDTPAAFHLDQTISWALRITPGVSFRTLRRAFDELVERHDSLRLRMVEIGSSWHAEILPKHPLGLIVEDLGEMSEERQRDVIAAYCATPLTALSEAMFEMQLLKFGGAGDVILARIHHTIIDGYSLALLFEELLKHVLNMPVSEAPLSHADFMAYRNNQLAENASIKDDFWRDALCPLPQRLKLGRQAKGLPPLSMRNTGPTNTLKNFLKPQTIARIDALSKSTEVSAFCHLHAAFSETLCAQAGQDAVLVHSIVGRRDAAIASFIGAEMLLFPLKYCQGSGAAWVSQQVAASSEMVPTKAFSKETRLGRELQTEEGDWYRFLVHIPTPTGRISSSPFRKVFEETLGGKISFGFITLERIELPKSTETDFEAQLNIYPTKSGPQASLVADAAGWSNDDLQQLAQEIEVRVQG